jgi:hypothetical protein
MSKTVPQLKKIDRGDDDKAEQISQPYAWQKAQQPKASVSVPVKPAATKPVAQEHSIRTVPVGPAARRRSR